MDENHNAALDMRIGKIETDLAEIKTTLDKVMELIVKADTTVASIAEQVKPTIDTLMESPILKMLGMKK